MGNSLAAESLLSLAVAVTSEHRVESALQRIVEGLAAQPGVALSRIWLLPSVHLPSFYHAVSNPTDCLCLVASAGTPINSPGEDWSFLQGHFARVPFNLGKVGQVAASRQPILVEDVTAENDWVVRPEWASREEICSFAGHSLVYRDKLLGVIAVFSRQPLRQPEFTWLGLFANQAALAIANACAEEALRSTERNLVALVNTIPTAAWTTRPDGYCDFLNQVWLDYTGMTEEQAQGWGWAEAIHPDERSKLVEEWQSCMASGRPVDTEARLRRYDSSYRWFMIRGNPLKDEEGSILKWYGTCVDIEARKQGEEALRTRELSWRQIVDNIPGLVATMGPMGEVEFLNRQTLEYFGKTNEDLKNWSLIGVVHPDDLPVVIEARKKSIESGQIYEVEHRCRRADGVYRWFQVRGVPVRDTEDKITAWYLLLTDIDDRKRAEQSLQSSERNLSLMISAIPAYIHVLRTDGSVLYANKAVLEYDGGVTLEEVQREDYRSRFFHPEDVDRLCEQRREALKRAVPFETEQRVLGKDGKYRWFLIRYNPLLDDQGRIDRWYVAAFDIDDRKRAEAELKQAYFHLSASQRLSKTGSTITDLMGDAHIWSEEAYRICEFEPGSKVTVQRFRDIIHPDDRQLFESLIARGLTGSDVDFVYRIVTSRGVKHLRGTARLMEYVAGRPLFIGALQDITESKMAEEALDRARSELAHVARITTLNALTASIAHEVNQPLSGIITNASTCCRMLDGDPPNVDGARETARRIIRDGNRASDVITRLRALFSKKKFSLEPLDLNEATREVIALSLGDLQRNRVVLQSNLAEDLPPIMGDRVQLQQVILNLVRNGADAMTAVEDRPRELVIRTCRNEGDQVRLIVKDVGVGLTPEAGDKLFEAFYTTKKDGMGIGLSVSRSIIEKHHGRLWAETNEGPGATFAFSIPCAPGDAPD